MRIIMFHIRLKVVFAKSILIQQLSFLFPKFFCFFLLRVFQLLFNFLILLRSFEFAQFLQLRMNYRIIDLSTNSKRFSRRSDCHFSNLSGNVRQQVSVLLLFTRFPPLPLLFHPIIPHLPHIFKQEQQIRHSSAVFLLYSAFCICPIRPSIRHSIHPVPKTY